MQDYHKYESRSTLACEHCICKFLAIAKNEIDRLDDFSNDALFASPHFTKVKRVCLDLKRSRLS